MAKNHDIETYPATLRHETDAAWLLDVGESEPVWFPKSQCEFDGDELQCPEWLAIEKGIA
jgi:hypothetical protein